MLQNEEVCGNTIYSSSEASGVNLACIYNSHATEISTNFPLKYDFWWATSFIF